MSVYKKGVQTKGYCAVTADILHRGHIKFLKSCKLLCDHLTVGVMTDKCVLRYKGHLPTMNFKERKLIIENLKLVDKVVPQNTYEMTPNIKKYKPNLVFDSLAHTRKSSYEYAHKHGCRVNRFTYSTGQSSSLIKERIRSGMGEKSVNWSLDGTCDAIWTNV